MVGPLGTGPAELFGPGGGEDPGHGEGAAADHDAGAAGFVEHVDDVSGLPDVAVADDGGASGGHAVVWAEAFGDGFDGAADAFATALTLETLLGGAPVDGHGADAGGDESAGQRACGVVGGVGFGPAEAHLGGEGDVVRQGGAHGFDDALGGVGDAHEFRSAVLLADLVNGATHVDVDDGGAVIGAPACAVGEQGGVGAVQLHADGLVEVVGTSEVERGFGVAEEAMRAEEVGAGEPDAAEGADGAAPGEIAPSGNGGEDEVRFKTNRTELEWGGKHGLWRSALLVERRRLRGMRLRLTRTGHGGLDILDGLRVKALVGAEQGGNLTS